MDLNLKLWIGTLDFENPLQQQMFLDRTIVFRDRLNWELSVDERGFEIDQYDIPNLTHYLILHRDGVHYGSLRLTPVQSACMAIEQFDGLCTLDMVEEPDRCAEVTRFCAGTKAELTARQAAQVSKDLMFENANYIYKSAAFDSCLGVFYPAMKRVYRRIGFEPVLLNEKDGLCVGQWTKQRYEEILRDRVK